MRESRNPYVNNDRVPKLIKSVVAFIDVLGYTDLVSQATREAKSQDLLLRLHGALQKARKYVEPWDRGNPLNELASQDFSAIRAFTDNIVIGYPIHTDGERELGNAFSDLSYFQMIMSMDGFFIRGGIAIGDLYMDEIAVYGNGFMEAYKAETTLARDPRIVLTRDAQTAVHQHLEYYGRMPHAPQNRNLLKDSDGQYFLDYMGTLITEENEIFLHDVIQHKKKIEEKLMEYQNRPAIWSKYMWAANYHNYFCDCSAALDDSHRVNTDDFTLKPVRIITTA